MKRFIVTSEQTAAAILDVAEKALEELGCRYVLIAEDAQQLSRRGCNSSAWMRGALEDALEIIMNSQSSDQSGSENPGSDEMGRAEP